MIRKGWLILAFWAAAAPLRAQTVAAPQQHESGVVNIEVPVRVFRKNAFVDKLTLQDFEVYENGVRQPLEAVYLIRNREVQREDKASVSAPKPSGGARHFVLFLDLKEYLPKIDNALNYFFSDVIAPGDSLSVITPAKTYRFKPDSLTRMKPAQIAEALKARLKKDIMDGNSRYRNLMRDFYKLEEIPYPPDLMELKEQMLFEIAMQIRDVSDVPESRVMAFADALKTLAGEKHVFLIFQKEVMPDHDFEESRQFELVKPVSFDIEKIKRAYSDASITVHFTYITKTPGFAHDDTSIGRPSMSFGRPDLSSEIYAAFKEMAVATGGLTESTANPDFGLRQAAEASKSYYLLCYRPLNYHADGGFRTIEVRVKGGGVDVTHRIGYIAD